MKRMMWPLIFITFLAISLVTSPAHSAGPPPFKSELLPCPNVANDVCGNFYALSVLPEPLTKGSVVVSATNILKVKVVGAFPNDTYEVVMISSAGGPFDVVGSFSTDANGDGSVSIPLPVSTYASGVILLRDSDGLPLGPCLPFTFSCPTGTGREPRIFTGFTVP